MKLTIPIRCATKQRPRVTKKGTFMPAEYRKWKGTFGMMVRQLCVPVPATGDLALGLKLSFKGKTRGDADNYAGAVMDACNGLLYMDDKQIKQLLVTLLEGTGIEQIEMELSPFGTNLFSGDDDGRKG